MAFIEGFRSGLSEVLNELNETNERVLEENKDANKTNKELHDEYKKSMHILDNIREQLRETLTWTSKGVNMAGEQVEKIDDMSNMLSERLEELRHVRGSVDFVRGENVGNAIINTESDTLELIHEDLQDIYQLWDERFYKEERMRHHQRGLEIEQEREQRRLAPDLEILEPKKHRRGPSLGEASLLARALKFLGIGGAGFAAGSIFSKLASKFKSILLPIVGFSALLGVGGITALGTMALLFAITQASAKGVREIIEKGRAEGIPTGTILKEVLKHVGITTLAILSEAFKAVGLVTDSEKFKNKILQDLTNIDEFLENSKVYDTFKTSMNQLKEIFTTETGVFALLASFNKTIGVAFLTYQKLTDSLKLNKDFNEGKINFEKFRDELSENIDEFVGSITGFMAGWKLGIKFPGIFKLPMSIILGTTGSIMGAEALKGLDFTENAWKIWDKFKELHESMQNLNPFNSNDQQERQPNQPYNIPKMSENESLFWNWFFGKNNTAKDTIENNPILQNKPKPQSFQIEKSDNVKIQQVKYGTEVIKEMEKSSGGGQTIISAPQTSSPTNVSVNNQSTIAMRVNARVTHGSGARWNNNRYA